MKNFSTDIIDEAKNTPKVLSKDFEVCGNGWHKDEARKWLKTLDARAEELGLDYNQCRDAAKLWRSGEFEKSLKKIWGQKVRVTDRNEDNGYTTIREYTVKGWAVYTEIIKRSALSGDYLHSITVHYDNLEFPQFPLTNPFYVYIKKKTTGLNSSPDSFIGQQKAADSKEWEKRVAHIYNCLFVGDDVRDCAVTLSGYNIKHINKLG